MTDLDKLDALAEAATPGPWRAAAGRAEPPEPTGLDAERLARAMAEVWPVSFRGEFASDNPSRRLLTDYANRIAAEYARLTDSGATDGE